MNAQSVGMSQIVNLFRSQTIKLKRTLEVDNMGFKVPDYVRVRPDALFIIGLKLDDKRRVSLAQYVNRTGWVRQVVNSEVKVFFPSINKSAWFDNDILEEGL